MLSLVLVLALADPNPPKTIITVKSSAVCGALRQNIAQSVQGLIANDTLADQGASLLTQSRTVAQAAPKSAAVTGGQGAGAQLDTMRMLQVVDLLVHNLERLDALLADSRAFPAVAHNDAEVALLHERDALRAVADKQRAELNILSTTAGTNAATDLNARSGIIGVGGAFVKAQTPQHVSVPEWFAQVQTQTKDVEAVAASGVQPLVDHCR